MGRILPRPKWDNKKYMNMKRLESALEDASILDEHPQNFMAFSIILFSSGERKPVAEFFILKRAFLLPI